MGVRKGQPPSTEWEAVLPLLQQLSGIPPRKLKAEDSDRDDSDSGSWETDTSADADAASTDAIAAATEAAAAETAPAKPDAAAAETAPAQPDAAVVEVNEHSIEQLCKLLWSAAIKNRDASARTSNLDQPGSEDYDYLIFIAENECMLELLSCATVAALIPVCKAAGLTAAAAAAAAAVQAVSEGLINQRAPRAAVQGAGSSEQDAERMICAAAARAEAAAAAAAGSSSSSSSGSSLTRGELLPALQLLTTLAVCARSQNINANSGDFIAQMAHKFFILMQLSGGGLLAVLSALCNDLAVALKQQQQQQQRQQGRSEHMECLQLLSSATLHLLRIAYMADRPAQLWWDLNLGPTVTSAVKLAAALQLVTDYTRIPPYSPPPPSPAADKTLPAAAAAVTVSSSSSSERFDQWVMLWGEDIPVGHEPTSLTSVFTHAVVHGLGYKGLVPPLSDALEMPEMQQLMCMYAAARAQRLHQLAGGQSLKVSLAATAAAASSSSSSRQQLQEGGLLEVPPWHEEVYAAFGMSEASDLTPVLALWDDKGPSLPVFMVLHIMSQLDDPSLWALYTIDEDGVLNFPAGPDSVREQLRLRQQQRQEQQQQGGAEAEAQGGEVVFMRHPKVRVALLRVLLQTVLLCPALKVGVLAFKVMSQIVVKGWYYDTPDLASALSAAAREVGDATGGALPAMLRFAGPAYIYLVTGAQQDPDTTANDMELLSVSYNQLVGVTVLADFLTGTTHLAETLQQQQAVALRSLEAAVRAAKGWQGRAMTINMFALTAALVNATRIHKALDSAPPAAAAAPAPAPAPAPAVTAAAAEGSGRSSPPSSSSSSGPELFGLLLTCLKADLSLAGARSAEGSMQAVSVSLNILVMCKILEQCGSEGEKVGNRWLWLAGRALMALVEQAQRFQAACFGGGHQSSEASALVGKCLLICVSTAEWLDERLGQLEPPVMETATATNLKWLLFHCWLQLQTRCHIVHDLLRREGPLEGSPQVMAMMQSWAAGAQGMALYVQKPLSPSLLLLVAALGRSVCGALPIPFACNNVECTLLAAVSEAASTKGGMCGACKVARYCCVPCQKAHRPQHKGVCGVLSRQAQAAVKACIDAA